MKPRGESHHCAKLTPDLVRHIRTSTATHYRLAKELRVSRQAIMQARNYQTWKHVA